MKTINKFEISKISYLEIILPCDKKDLFWTDFVEINLYYNHQTFSISTGFVFDAVGEAYLVLGQLLHSALQIEDSLQKELGYLRNEYFKQTNEMHERDKRFVFAESEKTKEICWIGHKYFIWSSSINSTETCVYEKNNVFFLEIVPTYPWFFKEPDINFITYEEFIKNYRPLLEIEIPQATVVALYEKMLELVGVLEGK